MCGIAGILRFDARASVDEGTLRRMRDILRHRGPDDRGQLANGRIGLAHRRLSIIDLAGGRQPMSNAERTVWIVFNGEIYNFRVLHKHLARQGYRFVTHSDTEVILAAYETFGEDCVRYLRGMFAFAIWDNRKQKLFLARDRLGIKPLYYAVTEAELLFGSEIKAILAAGSVKARFNRVVLPEFLANRYVAGNETFFEGICKLMPGHTLTWTPAEGIRHSRYWQLPVSTYDTDRPLTTIAREVREHLEDAVRSHLVSDVPVGLFLSGGIDSSALAAIMARNLPDAIHSFSVGFAEHGYNELEFAQRAAQAAGARHRYVLLSGADFFGVLPRMLWHEDEPIAFPSSISLYYVSRLAARDVKVVLTGEGADELFLGYNRYRVAAWNNILGRPYWSLVPRTWREDISRRVPALPKLLRRYVAHSFLAEPTSGIRGLFYDNFAVFPEAMQRNLLTFREPRRDPYADATFYFNHAPGQLLDRLSQSDLQTYLVELLMKQDQMSMAASLESRVPFLDHELVEYVAAMPARYKLRGWQTKAVLKAAVRDLVPAEILNRRKMGFPVPLGRWLRGAFSGLLDELLLSPRALDRGLFDPGYVRQLVAQHRDGAWDHSDRLWLLMNLEIWQRIFLENQIPEEILNRPAPQWGLERVA